MPRRRGLTALQCCPSLLSLQAAVEAARTALATTRSRSAVLEKAWAAAAEQARAEQVGGAADVGRHLAGCVVSFMSSCRANLQQQRFVSLPLELPAQSQWLLTSGCQCLPLIVCWIGCLQEARLEAQAQLEWTQKHVRELSAELAHAQVR